MVNRLTSNSSFYYSQSNNLSRQFNDLTTQKLDALCKNIFPDLMSLPLQASLTTTSLVPTAVNDESGEDFLQFANAFLGSDLSHFLSNDNAEKGQELRVLDDDDLKTQQNEEIDLPSDSFDISKVTVIDCSNGVWKQHADKLRLQFLLCSLKIVDSENPSKTRLWHYKENFTIEIINKFLNLKISPSNVSKKWKALTLLHWVNLCWSKNLQVLNKYNPKDGISLIKKRSYDLEKYILKKCRKFLSDNGIDIPELNALNQDPPIMEQGILSVYDFVEHEISITNNKNQVKLNNPIFDLSKISIPQDVINDLKKCNEESTHYKFIKILAAVTIIDENELFKTRLWNYRAIDVQKILISKLNFEISLTSISRGWRAVTGLCWPFYDLIYKEIEILKKLCPSDLVDFLIKQKNKEFNEAVISRLNKAIVCGKNFFKK